jgi:hypothetical protein
MRSIFAGIIMLSASMAVVHTAQAQKHGYGHIRASSGHRHLTHGDPQPSRADLKQIEKDRREVDPPAGPDDTIGGDQVHSEEDALTKRIEQDNARLDRELRGICSSC